LKQQPGVQYFNHMVINVAFNFMELINIIDVGNPENFVSIAVTVRDIFAARCSRGGSTLPTVS